MDHGLAGRLLVARLWYVNRTSRIYIRNRPLGGIRSTFDADDSTAQALDADMIIAKIELRQDTVLLNLLFYPTFKSQLLHSCSLSVSRLAVNRAY